MMLRLLTIVSFLSESVSFVYFKYLLFEYFQVQILQILTVNCFYMYIFGLNWYIW